MNSSATRPHALFLSNLAWDYLWQRHQTMASLFARDYDVVYCELPGLRRVGLRDTGRILRRFHQVVASTSKSNVVPRPSGLEVVRPFVVPSTNRIWHALNRVMLRRLLARHPAWSSGVDLVVTYTAARAARFLIDTIPHRRLVYECTDNFRAIQRLPASFAADESTLMQKADLTIVPGVRLASLHQSAARRIEVVPHGALVDRFLVPPAIPAPAPTLVYYGHIYTQHLDVSLVTELASSRPEWRIVLVGPILSKVGFPPNVSLPGACAHEKLREFLRQAHVIILPYALNAYTRTVVPAKMFECLATGRPIVATPLPELCAAFPTLIDYGSNAADFAQAVEQAWRCDAPAAPAVRIAAARANSWDDRYAQVRQLLSSIDAP